MTIDQENRHNSKNLTIFAQYFSNQWMIVKATIIHISSIIKTISVGKYN